MLLLETDDNARGLLTRLIGYQTTPPLKTYCNNAARENAGSNCYTVTPQKRSMKAKVSTLGAIAYRTACLMPL